MITVDALVEHRSQHWGRFTSRPGLVDPLDAFAGPRRAWERFRLKEWVGFTLIHPDWGGSMIIQDAKYLATSEIYGFDRATGELYEHSAAGRGRAVLPARLFDDGRCSFEVNGYRVQYAFDPDRRQHRIMIDIDESSAGPGFRGELQLDAGQACAPLAVSAQLRRQRLGSTPAMFTYKQIFPARGELEIAGHKVGFDPTRDFAIIDEHRTHLPYRADWDWGTFAFGTPAGIVGANLAARTQPAGTEDESCLWSPGGPTRPAAEPLMDVTFTPTTSDRPAGDGPAPTQVTSADGRVDLLFSPQGRKRAKHQLVVAAMDYFQECGTWRGTVRALDGARYELDGCPGVLERMHARL
jgi:hypothetical protein